MNRVISMMYGFWAWIAPAAKRAHAERRMGLTLRTYVATQPDISEAA
jgi:hypothetical protein